MDSYAEQIVRKADAGDSFKRMACMGGGVLIGIVLVLIGNMINFSIIGVVLGIGALYGGIYLSSNYDVEYEYSIVNGEIDIDKILAKKRRQKMFTVKVTSFEQFGIYTKDIEEKPDIVTISAIGDDKAYEIYYADFSDEKYGQCRLLFTPSDKVLREVKPYLKGQLRQVLADLSEEEEEN